MGASTSVEKSRTTPIVPTEGGAAAESLLSSISSEEGSGILRGSMIGAPKYDIGAEREKAVPTIEEELFVYDGVAISASAQKTSFRLSTLRRHKSSRQRSKFHFGDFSLDTIDEVEEAVRKDPRSPSAQDISKQRDRVLRNYDVTTASGLSQRVKCLALTPGEKELVMSCVDDTSIFMQQLKTRAPIMEFRGHQARISFVCYSYDGKLLATASYDKTLMLWDSITAKMHAKYPHPKVVICAAFMRDSRTVVTGCQDRLLRIWDFRQPMEPTRILGGHEGIVSTLAASPDATQLASGSSDKTLRVWDTATGGTKKILRAHESIVASCAYNSNSKLLFSVDQVQLVVWDTSTLTVLRTLVTSDFAQSARGQRIKAPSWTACCAAPGAFADYVIAACSNRFVYILKASTLTEEASIICKAPVHCVTSGEKSSAALGDTVGNIYILTLQ